LRRAFTLIELIFTIVILSVVAYVATGLIAKTYIGYNHVKALHKANLKIEIALNSIANRLEYAIDGTIVKRDGTTGIASIDSAPDDYAVLEWVGYDKDGFEANNIVSSNSTSVKDQPAWSGFCDIKNSTKNTIITPGSDLDFADDIIHRLSDDKAGLNIVSTVAIFFPGNYDYRNIGYKDTTGGTSGLGLISSFNSATNTFTLASSINRITEHYKLAWSAYAVLPLNCNNDGCDLYLRYNFRPWKGENYDNSQVKRYRQKLLATNVTVFKTYATANRVHVKICVKEKYGFNKDSSICKEKVVFK